MYELRSFGYCGDDISSAGNLVFHVLARSPGSSLTLSLTKPGRALLPLLAAAARLFVERGWQGARLEDVAQEAGLGVTGRSTPTFPGNRRCSRASTPRSCSRSSSVPPPTSRKSGQLPRRCRPHLRAVGLAREHQALTIPFLQAVTRRRGVARVSIRPATTTPIGSCHSPLRSSGSSRQASSAESCGHTPRP